MSDLTHLRQHYLTQPQEVSIETLALCNAACTFCPYGRLGREGERMPQILINSLISQMASWKEPFFVSPFKVNEPLLDWRMPEICAEIEREVPAASLRLFTNGQALTDKAMEWIANLKRLPQFWVSLNSCDSEEYHAMMALKFELTAKRMDALHAACRSGDFPHAVVVSRVVTGTGGTDSKDWAFVNAVRARWPLFQPFLIKRDAWIDFTAPTHAEVPRSGCARWFELNITAEGKAVLCCMDGKGEYVQGNVAEKSLLEIYNQRELQMRRLNALVPITRAGVEPCRRCSY
jgi:MoaA/NifB/PqqE/SkfB family radical SAM enzyme